MGRRSGKQLELEEIARALRNRAKVREDEIPLAAEIAVALLGHHGLVFGHPDAGARLVGQRIVVPKIHPDLNFVIAHELGEWALRYIAGFSGTPNEKERAANYIAGAIVAPPAAVVAAHPFYGEQPQLLASVFGVSQTSITLRLGEVLGDERAVVTANHNNVMAIGPTWRTIPVVDVVRKGLPRPDLVKTALSGGIDEGRVALRMR